ncbi:DUF1266 domain-containing protein [Pseudomonas sp. B6002]|uniref:DUF1266 domain-containing protein n=1 Tax=Pseudomonas sp. B6002 TaxID=2726978 RepID=UPI0015A2AF54|nr:DUF1266 domain-containing protein [Pseudomonas sp. B6002]NVZ53758.1 DUF1266 domain-containing protein [Pseudomonas sp. B6002]
MDETQRRWLYALSAPMVALNPGAGYAEPAFYADPSYINLNCSWGINDRDQLFDMLGMADDGHARHLNDAYDQWSRCLPSEWQTLLSQLDPRERALYEFASRTHGECGEGGIRAWDLGRMGFLLRCGLRNQWIDAPESLWLQSRIALRARHHYGDWNSYFNGFLIGHAFWRCEGLPVDSLTQALNRQGNCESKRLIVNALVNDEAAFLEGLPWELALAAPPRPTSLRGFDWS